MVLFNLGSKKSSSNVPHVENREKNGDCEKKNKLGSEEVTSTITRSRRISRRPSNWWVVKSEHSKYFHSNYFQ